MVRRSWIFGTEAFCAAAVVSRIPVAIKTVRIAISQVVFVGLRIVCSWQLRFFCCSRKGPMAANLHPTFTRSARKICMERITKSGDAIAQCSQPGPHGPEVLSSDAILDVEANGVR